MPDDQLNSAQTIPLSSPSSSPSSTPRALFSFRTILSPPASQPIPRQDAHNLPNFPPLPQQFPLPGHPIILLSIPPFLPSRLHPSTSPPPLPSPHPPPTPPPPPPPPPPPVPGRRPRAMSPPGFRCRSNRRSCRVSMSRVASALDCAALRCAGVSRWVQVAWRMPNLPSHPAKEHRRRHDQAAAA